MYSMYVCMSEAEKLRAMRTNSVFCSCSMSGCCCGAMQQSVRWYRGLFFLFSSEYFHRKPESHTQRHACSQTATAGGLTAGAVGAPPARLTLAGVGGHTTAVNTALRTMSWTWSREEDTRGISTVTETSKTDICIRISQVGVNKNNMVIIKKHNQHYKYIRIKCLNTPLDLILKSLTFCFGPPKQDWTT